MDFETLNALQVLALHSVEYPTYEDSYRAICRWFSKEFSTPLKEVEEMADEYVLKHYYEHTYGEIKNSTNEKAEENYALLKASILQTEEEKTVEELDDDAWAAALTEELAKQANSAISKTISEIDEHIKTVQQGGEVFDGFETEDFEDDETML